MVKHRPFDPSERQLDDHSSIRLERKARKQDIPIDDIPRYREQAGRFSQERLLRMLDGFMRTESELRYASSPRIGVEVASLRACAEAQGEDTTALLERIATLEMKLNALTTALDHGQYAPASPAKPATAKIAETPAAPVGDTNAAKPKQAPTNEQEIWDQALMLIAKTEPPLFGLLKKERFIGAKGTVYQLQVAFERKDFSLVSLNKPNRKDTVARALSEVSGTPLTFEAVLEGDGRAVRDSDLRDQNAQTLIESFGRDAVQIDDSNSKT